PDTRSRYLRVRVLDGTTEYAITSVAVGYNLSVAAERGAAGGPLVLSPAFSTTRQSTWTSDADLSAVPISAVEFKTSQTSFSRVVLLLASDDGDRLRAVGTGQITAQA